MAKFERVSRDSLDWGKTLATFPDAIVYQTPAWIAFLAETQNAEPVLAALKEGDDTLGYFTGLIVKKLGLRILGSPFRGWSTPYMGFNLRADVPRRAAIAALSDLAFRQLGCLHFEAVDSHLTLEDIDGLGLGHEMHATYETDLLPDEATIFANFSSSCRRNIRHAEKNRVVIEEARDQKFAEEYAEQLKDVFAKQGLVPNFTVDRVRAVIRHLQPAGLLLTLRARDSEGRCIATGLYPACNQTAFYWGGASWREYQKLYPNELLHWAAMRYWKSRGLKSYNLVGTMDFKQRFGGRQTAVPMIVKSKYRAISQLRSSAPRIAKSVQHLLWRLKNIAKRKRDDNRA